MKKAAKTIAIGIIIFALIGPFLLFVEQVINNREEEEQIPTYAAQGSVMMGDIHMTEYELNFETYLARTDKDLDEKELADSFYAQNQMLLTADLPLELQPKLMYVTDKEGSFERMCDRARFPHNCPVELENFGDEMEKEFVIKVTFEDGGYFEDTILVPRTEVLEKPEVVEPTTLPEQNSSLAMKFKDIGADTYKVGVRFCYEYQNDGIDPCLDGVEYMLKRENGKLKFDNYVEPLDPVTFGEKDGLIEITSDKKLMFGESIVYEIEADKEITEDSVTYFLQSFGRKSFERENK